uniref:Zinc finger protein 385D-like n=1 Tax=Hippocampus comes TaxID=109280 RepID=A0A3Q2YN65_HIPCM
MFIWNFESGFWTLLILYVSILNCVCLIYFPFSSFKIEFLFFGVQSDLPPCFAALGSATSYAPHLTDSTIFQTNEASRSKVFPSPANDGDEVSRGNKMELRRSANGLWSAMSAEWCQQLDTWFPASAEPLSSCINNVLSCSIPDDSQLQMETARIVWRCCHLFQSSPIHSRPGGPPGNTCHNGLVHPVTRSALPSVHSALGIKHFLPFPLDNNVSPAVNIFPGFNTMDPVQKAVLHHTLGLLPAATAAAPKRRHVSCGVCRLRFNSQNQALAHYKGTKHARKLKARDTPKSKLKGTPLAKEPRTDRKDAVPTTVPPPLSSTLRLAIPSESTVTRETPTDVAGTLSSVTNAPEVTSEFELNLPSETEPDLDPDKEPEKDAETEEEKARRLLYCSLCKVAVNSASQLEAHNSGTKHKTMLEARSGVGSIKSFPRPGIKGKVAPPSSSKASTGLQNKTFYCETCDVHVNSETQLKQHISSRRHKDRAAGKPAKPKYTPYSKGATKQTIKLSLGKERPCPPLAALLPTQLMAAAAAALGSTFPQRPTHGPASNPALFPTPPLTTPLLRPTAGPIRTAHPQVLFAPY